MCHKNKKDRKKLVMGAKADVLISKFNENAEKRQEGKGKIRTTEIIAASVFIDRGRKICEIHREEGGKSIMVIT